MTVASTTVWEVRQAGSSTNGGGFDTATAGTNYSLQNSPQVTFDGATIYGTTTGGGVSVVTVVGYTVASTDVGNIVNITGGANFTTGRYEISVVNVGGNAWTLDRAVSTDVGSGMTGYMGGALASIEEPGGSTSAGNTVFIGNDFARTWQSAGGTYTNDLAATNATPSVLSSASYNFVAADVHGVVKITSGTNFVAGSYRIVSVSSNNATLDRNCTTGSAATAGTGSQCIPWTSASTRAITDAGTAANHIMYCGYLIGGTRDITQILDEDDMPVFTSATNSTAIISLNSSSNLEFYNIKITSSAATRGNGWTNATATSTNITFFNCVVDGCLSGWFSTSSSSTSFSVATWFKCEARNCTGTGAGTNAGFRTLFGTSDYIFFNCISRSNAGSGFITGGASNIKYIDCISCDNTSDGFHDAATTTGGFRQMINCVSDNNGGNGEYYAYTSGGITGGSILINNIFYGNTTAGSSCATAGVMSLNNPLRINNAYGNNGTARTNVRAGIGEITLSADPFTDRANNDYSLNNTAGGGVLLRQLSYPTYLGIGDLTASYKDIGASQAVDTPGGGGSPIGSRFVRT